MDYRSLFLLLFSIAFVSWNSSVPYDSMQIKKQTLKWQEIERSYLYYLPKDAHSSESFPILLSLHGGGGKAEDIIKVTHGRFNELADEKRFIVVYPNAINKNWNDGRFASPKPGQKDTDDVGFIKAIIEDLKSKYNIDQKKIYASGISNGGFMTSRLLCDAAEVISGGAILTATLSKDYFPLCNPTKPTSIVIFNGTDDDIVPYDGGQVKVFNKVRGGKIISTDELLDFWKSENGCNLKPQVEHLKNRKRFDRTTVSIETYENCKDEVSVSLFKIKGGGHTWPGGKQYLPRILVGNTSREINACDEIVKFFKL